MRDIFFNDTATTEIYTLSLHDALPIFRGQPVPVALHEGPAARVVLVQPGQLGEENRRLQGVEPRSEEHTSELQSRQYLVCRLLLEQKKRETSQHRGLALTCRPTLHEQA